MTTPTALGVRATARTLPDRAADADGGTGEDSRAELVPLLFVAEGRYDGIRILRDRDEAASFDAFPKRNEFAFRSLLSNAVLRWKYRPGSTLYAVWTHGRRADDELNPLAPWGPSPYGGSIGDQIGDTFDIFPENVFLIKFSYTFLN